MINNVTLVGRMVAPAETRTTLTGKTVARFTIAIDRKRGGEEKATDFIDCCAWNKTAEFINKWFKKGDWIAVQGAIATDNYTDKDGNKRKAVNVVVYEASFCSSLRTIDDKPEAPATAETDDAGGSLPFDDLPF